MSVELGRDDSSAQAVKRLLSPEHLYSRDEVLRRPSAVPKVSGIYAWYFDQPLPGVDIRGCHAIEGNTLLYVGIAPREPPRNGLKPSTQTLRHRIRYHYRGNAYGSTLRLTLGCHLAETLGITLRRVGSGDRLTFTPEGERQIDEWMSLHARVAWTEVDSPWHPEDLALKVLSLPLNLQGNGHHAYYQTLKDLRAEQRAAARGLPIV